MTYRVINHGSIDSWKAARRDGIGGRDIGSIMGNNPYRCGLRIAYEKLGKIPEPVVTSEAAFWGDVLEPSIARRFGELEGRDVKLCEKHTSYVLEDEPWVRCSLDALQTTKDGHLWPLDIKTTSAWSRDKWEAPYCPPDVYDQIQWQAMILGAPMCSAVCLLGGQELLRRDFKADRDHQAAMLDAARKFWSAIQERRIPDGLIDGSDDCQRLLGEVNPSAQPGKTIELPQEADSIDMRIGILEGKIKELDDERKKWKNVLRDMLKDAEIGRLQNGMGGWSFKLVRRGGYEVKPSETRTLRRIK